MYRRTRILWTGFVALFGLGFHAFGAGFPVAWGNPTFGLNNPPVVSNAITMSAGYYHNLAVLDNGTVIGWGDNTLTKATAPPGLSGVVAVACGANHSLALRNNGRVVAWGDPTVTNVPAGLIDAMRIAAGQFHSLVVRSNRTVIAWGANNHGQSSPPPLNTAVAVAAGAEHSLALRADGTVVAWGHNGFGQSTVPFGLSGVIAIAAGDFFSMALRNNGTIVVWGNIAAPPAHSGVTAIAAGGSHCVGLRSDRTVFCWGDNSLNQCVVPGGTTNVIAVAAGATHTAALRMAPPRITAHPTPRTLVQGQTTTFNVSVTGSTPYRFQWRHNDVDISNATNASYTISNVQSNHAGNYRVMVSNTVGSHLSTNAMLTVNVPAFISQGPQDREAIAGGSATFSVTPGGTAPFRYQWQKGGTNIAQATNANFVISPVNTNHAGNYRVVVSNAFGVATSAVATLTVRPIPVITTQPQSQTVAAGTPASFSVVADHATGYQWRKDNANIPGANAATYSIGDVQTGHAGNYRVVVTNQFGAVTSVVATLTVQVLPPLRLHAPERLQNGNMRLRIANQDGSPIAPARASKIEVFAAPDPALPLPQWTKRTITLALVNGVLQGDDVAPLPNLRFYVARESL